jgi:hypothetical protein
MMPANVKTIRPAKILAYYCLLGIPFTLARPYLSDRRAFAAIVLVLVLVVVLVIDSPSCPSEDEDEDRSLRSLRTRTIAFRHPFLTPLAEQTVESTCRARTGRFVTRGSGTG